MRRSVGNSHRGNMRSGLISLLTVVVVISLATAAVLTVSTSHAMNALAQRHATMTREAYAAESSAQTLLAKLDAELAPARAAGEGTGAMIQRVDSRINSLLAESCAEGVLATYSIDGTAITCTFVTKSGRTLTTTLVVSANASPAVVAWRLTAAPQDESTGDVLWSGSTARE